MVQRCDSETLFGEVAKATREVGHPWVFALALGTVVVWAISGPFFNFFGHMAARDQHRHNDRNLPDGLPDSKFAEPGLPCHPSEAG